MTGSRAALALLLGAVLALTGCGGMNDRMPASAHTAVAPDAPGAGGSGGGSGGSGSGY